MVVVAVERLGIAPMVTHVIRIVQPAQKVHQLMVVLCRLEIIQNQHQI